MNDTPSPPPADEPDATSPAGEVTSDGRFSVKVTEDMALRNLLRSGLVEAQGRDGGQIPLFVSWPHWLEDGIMCLYVKDFNRILDETFRQMTDMLRDELSRAADTPEPAPPAPEADTADSPGS